MNELQIFNNEEFGSVRTTIINGEPYFVGKDVAEILGYSNTRDALAAHVDEEDKTIIQKSEIATLEIPNRGLTVINESGMYSLVLSSKLPAAKKFKRWITSEVIPSIRKNGGYIAGQESMSDEELMAKAILVAQRKIEDQKRIIKSQLEIISEKDEIITTHERKIEEDKPKTLFADTVHASEDSIPIGDLAKFICQKGYKIGRNQLFKWMRDNGYLIKSGASKNIPTQRYVEQGLFEIEESTVTKSDGTIVLKRTTKVTGKGQIYFVNIFLKDVVAA